MVPAGPFQVRLRDKPDLGLSATAIHMNVLSLTAIARAEKE